MIFNRKPLVYFLRSDAFYITVYEEDRRFSESRRQSWYRTEKTVARNGVRIRIKNLSHIHTYVVHNFCKTLCFRASLAVFFSPFFFFLVVCRRVWKIITLFFEVGILKFAHVRAVVFFSEWDGPVLNFWMSTRARRGWERFKLLTPRWKKLHSSIFHASDKKKRCLH